MLLTTQMVYNFDSSNSESIRKTCRILALTCLGLLFCPEGTFDQFSRLLLKNEGFIILHLKFFKVRA